MSPVEVKLIPVAKKKPAAESRAATEQVNFRVTPELNDAFEKALGRMIPEVDRTAILKMCMMAFAIDPEAFVTQVKQFIAGHGRGSA